MLVRLGSLANIAIISHLAKKSIFCQTITMLFNPLLLLHWTHKLVGEGLEYLFYLESGTVLKCAQ